jgi:hypothetical protein
MLSSLWMFSCFGLQGAGVFPLSDIVKRTYSRSWSVPPVVGRRGGTYWGSAVRKGLISKQSLDWFKNLLYYLKTLNCCNSVPSVVDEWVWSIGRMILIGENQSTAPVPQCTPQILQNVARSWTWASAVTA